MGICTFMSHAKFLGTEFSKEYLAHKYLSLTHECQQQGVSTCLQKSLIPKIQRRRRYKEKKDITLQWVARRQRGIGYVASQVQWVTGTTQGLHTCAIIDTHRPLVQVRRGCRSGGWYTFGDYAGKERLCVWLWCSLRAATCNWSKRTNSTSMWKKSLRLMYDVWRGRNLLLDLACVQLLWCICLQQQFTTLKLVCQVFEKREGAHVWNRWKSKATIYCVLGFLHLYVYSAIQNFDRRQEMYGEGAINSFLMEACLWCQTTDEQECSLIRNKFCSKTLISWAHFSWTGNPSTRAM